MTRHPTTAARCWRSGPTTPAVRARIRAALVALPPADRRSHLTAVVALLHLTHQHCPEGREPHVFIAGPRAYAAPALHWAARLLHHKLEPCVPDCDSPDHITLITRSMTGVEGEEGDDGV